MVLIGADGEGRPADGRARTCTSATSPTASCRPSAPLGTGALTLAGHGDGVRARRSGRVVVSFIGEGGIVAGRVARGDQPVRGAAAAGDLLCPEQPDRALDAGARTSPPSACSPTRPRATAFPGITHRRHRSRRDRRRLHLGGRARARRPGADADRAGVDAHVRPRASRRHAVSREGLRRVVGLSDADASRATSTATLWAFWAARDPIPAYAARLEADGVIGGERSRPLQARGRSAGRSSRRALVVEAPWPEAEHAAEGVFADRAAAARVSRCWSPAWRQAARRAIPICRARRSRAAVRSQGQHVPRRR